MKQVIVVRKDLAMDTGKLVSQACHACLAASETAKKQNLLVWKTWRREGGKKVVVKVFSLEALLELEKQAQRRKVPHALIIDKGLTQLPPQTPTTLGIGPAPDQVIDELTGELRLL